MNENAGTYKFSFSFGGENKIPISSLCKSLDSLNSLLIYAQDSEVPCDYKLETFSEGSVVANIIGEYVVPASIFLAQNQNYIKTAVGVVSEWIKIKKNLKGKMPKSVESEDERVKIVGSDNKVFYTDLYGAKLFENAVIHNAVISFGSALQGCNRKDFVIEGDDGEHLLELPSDSFEDVGVALDLTSITKDRFYSAIVKNAFLLVKKSVLMGPAKWEFFYRNHGISVKVEDEAWLRKVSSGLVDIRGKMAVVGDLREEGKQDNNGMPIESTMSYALLKVHSVEYDVGYDQTKLQ